ncbi:MAG: hypothetical protein J5I91_01040 [Bacteroidetes bacterium]|nr:hypothetical protein [Bacteroidota bacterium]
MTLISTRTFAQQITWGEDPRANSKNAYFMTIGENESGIYILSHSSRKKDITRFAIEHYNHDLFFLNSKSIRQRGQKLLKIQTLNNNLFFAMGPSSQKSGLQTITGYLIDSRLEDYSKQIALMKLHVESHNQDYFFKIKSAPNFDKIGVLGFVDNTQQKGKNVYYNLFDENLDTIVARNFLLNLEFDENNISEVFIDKNGNFYLTIEYSNEKIKIGEGRYTTELIYCNLKTNQIIHIPITDKGFRVRDVNFTSDDSMNVVFASGFFGAEINEYQKGIFQIGIDEQTGKIEINTFTDIPITFVSDVLGEKYSNKGTLLNNFYIKKIVRTTDNRSILIAERYFTDTYFDQYWMNGVPLSISHRLYHYDEIILICLDTLGSISWNKVIQKKQASQDDYGYFSSILIGVSPDYISILYNDRMSRSKDVLQYRVSKDGDIKTDILLPAEEVYTFIIPIEGKQTGYDRIVVPVLRDREYSIIKITYNNKSIP